MYNDTFLNHKLNERKQQQAFRSLKLPQGKIDFCSNDYLGIALNQKLQTHNSQLNNSSTGSRLLAGNYELIELAEQEIAIFHQSETALLYNSGYDANLGLLSCVPQKGDTIIYDYLCHASIRDGIRLSFAQSFSFAHNGIEDLEKKLQLATGNVFVVTESIFSMDGDICPLQELLFVSEKYNAHLIIDEAHATGVIGARGEGLVQHLQLQQKIFARVHTFGKACGCHGAVILGSNQLRDYLINFSRSLMYSTALPPHTIEVIRKSYTIFPVMKEERIHLQHLIQLFQLAVIKYEKFLSTTPIQIVMVPGNQAVKQLAQTLQDNNLDVRPILYPTVPKEKERLRIVLHAFNTYDEVKHLIELLQ